MLRASIVKLVKACGEVLTTGNLSLPTKETTLITLAHVALSSEDVEIEVVFVMCVVAAVHSYHRDYLRSLFVKENALSMVLSGLTSGAAALICTNDLWEFIKVCLIFTLCNFIFWHIKIHFPLEIGLCPNR
ncbi:hypothetical protein DsansV1_C26g0190421 [Dioscorea sansibarensis]